MATETTQTTCNGATIAGPLCKRERSFLPVCRRQGSSALTAIWCRWSVFQVCGPGRRHCTRTRQPGHPARFRRHAPARAVMTVILKYLLWLCWPIKWLIPASRRFGQVVGVPAFQVAGHSRHCGPDQRPAAMMAMSRAPGQHAVIRPVYAQVNCPVCDDS